MTNALYRRVHIHILYNTRWSLRRRCRRRQYGTKTRYPGVIPVKYKHTAHGYRRRSTKGFLSRFWISATSVFVRHAWVLSSRNSWNSPKVPTFITLHAGGRLVPRICDPSSSEFVKRVTFSRCRVLLLYDLWTYYGDFFSSHL